MNRRSFIKNTGILGVSLVANPQVFMAENRHIHSFPEIRISKSKRNFTSVAIENAITEFSRSVHNQELVWLFQNCFPNTLDTTVFYSEKKGRPYTYVITGDIDAMWLRDSSAQVYPYVEFANKDKKLQNLIAGVINQQTEFILLDPYANAFYNDKKKISEWTTDHTTMKPGVHERKWELDSLCYPIRLAYKYWQTTQDDSPFDITWKESVQTILSVCKEQQRKTNDGSYTFRRNSEWAIDAVPMMGKGYKVNPVGLIASIFRPSDDATIFPFLIPSNFFMMISLRQAAEMILEIHHDPVLSNKLNSLSIEVEDALHKYGIVEHPKYGAVYAFEIDGNGSVYLSDDANVPNLLSLPYLGAVEQKDVVYQNTRKYVWSPDNPFFYSGKVAQGIGGHHKGEDMIWPMSIIMKGLTSDNDHEIRACIQLLQITHANTGFMHEAFHKDDAGKFSRPWFAWANTLFGELLYKTFRQKPELLNY